MKIIVVGGTGTIGKAVVQGLTTRHEVISVGLHHGEQRVDITDPASIEAMYHAIGAFDALIVTAGEVHFAPLQEMRLEDYCLGLRSKLMGQVALVLKGLPFIRPQGSFTLTSGILNRDPIRQGSSAAMVNGAIDAYVKSAALELPKNIRINSVSPTVIAESWPRYQDYFHGFEPVPVQRVALAYSKSVEGAQTGQVYIVD